MHRALKFGKRLKSKIQLVLPHLSSTWCRFVVTLAVHMLSAIRPNKCRSSVRNHSDIFPLVFRPLCGIIHILVYMTDRCSGVVTWGLETLAKCCYIIYNGLNQIFVDESPAVNWCSVRAKITWSYFLGWVACWSYYTNNGTNYYNSEMEWKTVQKIIGSYLIAP